MPYRLPITNLSCMIREKDIGIEELVRIYLERIIHYDGPNGLNAIAELDSDAVAKARALDLCRNERNLPLFGIPILIKDNIDVAGFRTTAGSCALANNIADVDAPVVAGLRKHGAIILGKTNMTEFANYVGQDMPNGYSSLGGQVKNAYSNAKDPGGSSSGSAVAVSAGFCAAALGTDTSFSVVACATVNGVTGLKPPVGTLSQDGIIPIAHSLDSIGTFTRSFSDAVTIYNCMREKPLKPISPSMPDELKIAVNTYNSELVSKAQLSRYNELFERLKKVGVKFGEVLHRTSPYVKTVMQCEFRHDFEKYLSKTSSEFKTLEGIINYYEANSQHMMKYGNGYLKSALYDVSGNLDDKQYLDALSARRLLREQLMEELRDYDACVMFGWSNVMHFVGFPSVALRLGMGDDGTPRGIILYGPDEKRLYSAALTIEKFCEPVDEPFL